MTNETGSGPPDHLVGAPCACPYCRSPREVFDASKTAVVMRENDPIQLRSPDGYLLLGKPGAAPLVTCELRSKWYSLFVIHPNRHVEPLLFIDVGHYVDHWPDPFAVDRFAEARGWEVDEFAIDLIRGRWENER